MCTQNVFLGTHFSGCIKQNDNITEVFGRGGVNRIPGVFLCPAQRDSGTRFLGGWGGVAEGDAAMR